MNKPPADPSILQNITLSFSPRSYTKSYSRKPGWRMLKSQANGDCVFLKDGRQCTVYSARPLQCSTYPWWPELMDDGGCTPAGAAAHDACMLGGSGHHPCNEQPLAHHGSATAVVQLSCIK